MLGGLRGFDKGNWSCFKFRSLFFIVLGGFGFRRGRRVVVSKWLGGCVYFLVILLCFILSGVEVVFDLI